MLRALTAVFFAADFFVFVVFVVVAFLVFLVFTSVSADDFFDAGIVITPV